MSIVKVFMRTVIWNRLGRHHVHKLARLRICWFIDLVNAEHHSACRRDIFITLSAVA